MADLTAALADLGVSVRVDCSTIEISTAPLAERLRRLAAASAELADAWEALPAGARRAVGDIAITLRADPALESKMNFGQAIEALKAGERVQRAGWNGKGMWLALTPASVVPTRVPSPDGWVSANLRGAAAAYALAEPVDEIRIGAHIDIRAADGSLVIGWLASQTDMLAEDWVVLP